jgi:V/A-type H+-transporting ATPase subunit K
MFLTFYDFILPLILLVVISLPLIKVFSGKAKGVHAKRRFVTHLSGFFSVLAFVLLLQLVLKPRIFGFESDNSITGTIAQGLGFLSAALSTGLSALGAGIAVAAAAPAAIGSFSEDEKNFGKSMIFVALGEGVAIYGILISILIINQLG